MFASDTSSLDKLRPFSGGGVKTDEPGSGV